MPQSGNQNCCLQQPTCCACYDECDEEDTMPCEPQQCEDPKPRPNCCGDSPTNFCCEDWRGMPGCRRCRFLHCRCGMCRRCRMYEYVLSINPGSPCICNNCCCNQQNPQPPRKPNYSNNTNKDCRNHQPSSLSECKEGVGGVLVSEYKDAYRAVRVGCIPYKSGQFPVYCKPPWRSTLKVEPICYQASLAADELKLQILDEMLHKEGVKIQHSPPEPHKVPSSTNSKVKGKL